MREEEKIALVRKLYSIAPAQRENYIESVLKQLPESNCKNEVSQCLRQVFETIDQVKIKLN